MARSFVAMAYTDGSGSEAGVGASGLTSRGTASKRLRTLADYSRNTMSNTTHQPISATHQLLILLTGEGRERICLLVAKTIDPAISSHRAICMYYQLLKLWRKWASPYPASPTPTPSCIYSSLSPSLSIYLQLIFTFISASVYRLDGCLSLQYILERQRRQRD